MASPFQYATWLQVRQELSRRLNDVSQICWTDAEVGLYVKESLRFWNALTQQWLADWTTTYTNTALPWQSTGNAINALVGANPSSPRVQTLTDADLYTMAQYHLLEPPTGATWTGTSQFNIADFADALEGHRDTVLQVAACNIGPFSNSFGITPGTNRVALPDSTSKSILDIRRIRFIPATGLGIAPSTLYREDGMAFEFFENDYEQTTAVPFAWDVLAGPPQTLTFDALASVPNTLDILAMLSGGNITPPTPAPLLIPDDFAWVLKFGMMHDLLSKESESTDLERADYCEKRFQEGLRLMVEMPWLTQARLNGVPCDTPSMSEADDYDNEWQSNPNAQPQIVRGGIDLFAVSPTITAGNPVAVSLTLVGNAPMPVADGDFVQVSRDVLDAILMEAQHLAQFKHCGKEFADSMPLHKEFIQQAVNTSSRLRDSGIFADVLRPPVSRQTQADPRFAVEEKI